MPCEIDSARVPNMFTSARFDPSAPEATKSQQLTGAEPAPTGLGGAPWAATDSNSPWAALSKRPQAGRPQEKNWGHLSGAQRRARARAREEGREWSPHHTQAKRHRPEPNPVESSPHQGDAGVAPRQKMAAAPAASEVVEKPPPTPDEGAVRADKKRKAKKEKKEKKGKKEKKEKRDKQEAKSKADGQLDKAIEDEGATIEAEEEVESLDIGQLQSRLEQATDSRPTHRVADTANPTSSDQGLPAWLEKTQLIQLQAAAPDAFDDDNDAGAVVTFQDIGVDERLCTAARECLGVRSLFPAQQTAIPAIMRHPGDVLISAPTGSGKTLVYAIPVLNDLAKRVVPRLRAVILLPTQDLALQVFHVFQALIEGAGLDLTLAGVAGKDGMGARTSEGLTVDLIVATPGRLVNYMKKSDSFSLQSLRWLVIDDADRLLQQSYQDWVSEVMIALPCRVPASASRRCPATLSSCNWAVMRDPNIFDVKAAENGYGPRKLVLSATLTQNPAKLFALQLNQPLSLHAAEDSAARYVLPRKLTEQAMIVPTHLKPLAVIQILKVAAAKDGGAVPPTVVFASTVEATHRLYRLLQLFGTFSTAEYSSRLPSTRRRQILEELQNGKVQVVVCSDVMTRGIDVSAVRLVINYDTPSHIKTYIHRVGRTARANKTGLAITLLRREDVRPFRELRKKAALPVLAPEPIGTFRDQLSKESELETRYTACLTKLETIVHHEKIRILDETAAVDPLPDDAGSVTDVARSTWGSQLIAMQTAQLHANLKRNTV